MQIDTSQPEMQFFAVLQQMSLPQYQSGQEKEHFCEADFTRQRKNCYYFSGFENFGHEESKVNFFFAVLQEAFLWRLATDDGSQ